MARIYGPPSSRRTSQRENSHEGDQRQSSNQRDSASLPPRFESGGGSTSRAQQDFYQVSSGNYGQVSRTANDSQQPNTSWEGYLYHEQQNNQPVRVPRASSRPLHHQQQGGGVSTRQRQQHHHHHHHQQAYQQTMDQLMYSERLDNYSIDRYRNQDRLEDPWFSWGDIPGPSASTFPRHGGTTVGGTQTPNNPNTPQYPGDDEGDQDSAGATCGTGSNVG